MQEKYEREEANCMMSNKCISLLITLILFSSVVVYCKSINNSDKIKSNYKDKLTEYKAFLDSLDVSKKESIHIAKDQYWRVFPVGSLQAEDGFRLFKTFHIEIVRHLDREFYGRKDIQKVLWNFSILRHMPERQYLPPITTIDEELKKKIQQQYPNALQDLYEYSQCGVDFYTAEGDWYIQPDYDYYLEEILRDYHLSLKNYLRFMKDESKEIVARDAGLIIQWEELRNKITRFERFAVTYPDIPETTTDILQKLDGLMHLYLYGLDNTPINYSTKDVKQSWQKFLIENKNSRYFKKVEKRYHELKALEPQEDVAFTAIVKKIQEAKPSDIIEVPAGKYNVDYIRGLRLTNKENITLKSKDGKVEFYSDKDDRDIIQIYNCRNIVIDGFTVYHNVDTKCSATCIAISDSKDIIIQNNDIHGSGAYGVGVWGHNNKNIRILNNTIHDCSYWGVELFSESGEISNNTFYNNGIGNYKIHPKSKNIVQRNNKIKKR